jgi:hypothetical protein
MKNRLYTAIRINGVFQNILASWCIPQCSICGRFIKTKTRKYNRKKYCKVCYIKHHNETKLKRYYFLKALGEKINV